MRLQGIDCKPHGLPCASMDAVRFTGKMSTSTIAPEGIFVRFGWEAYFMCAHECP